MCIIQRRGTGRDVYNTEQQASVSRAQTTFGRTLHHVVFTIHENEMGKIICYKKYTIKRHFHVTGHQCLLYTFISNSETTLYMIMKFTH